MLVAPVVTVKKRMSPRRMVLAVLLAGAILGAAAFVGSRFFEDGPLHPQRWDGRVRELVSFVEATRGHRYDHPVSVYFLSPDQYSDAIGAAEDMEVTAEQRSDSARDVAELRALGLIEGDPDLLAATKDLADGGTLAFYDHELDVINVRGSAMTAGLRTTLVHELTHALQDQLFDVGRLLALPSEEAVAARSVLEGDATAVENGYVEQLDPVDREAFDAESAEAGEEAESNLDEVPEVLTTLFGMPYALGPAFVDLVNARAGGPRLDRVDRVYRDLPASTAEMFDPASYFDDLDPAELKAPSFPDADDDRSDVMGAAVLFVMLAERIPPAHAMAAVDGWLGDASFSGRVRDHGKRRVCVQVRTRVATPADVVELTGALEDWKRAMPNQDLISVSKDRRHKTVLFRSCDPGSKVTVGVTGNSRDALLLPVARTQIASGQINLGIPRDRALCVGTEVASRLRPEDLKAEDVTDELRDRVGELIAEAVASC